MTLDQPMPVEGQQSVTAEVIRLIRAREAKGIETYGRTLQTFNGRDALTDAIEECADLLQYLVQFRMERDSLQSRISSVLQSEPSKPGRE